MLEAGLKPAKRLSWRAEHMMVSPVTQIHPWESIRDARIRLLENSFSFLPMWHEAKWWLVSDLVVARWMIKNAEGNPARSTVRDLAPELDQSLCPELLSPDTTVDKVILILDKTRLPVLVVGDTDTIEGKAKILGMITPFDLL